MLNERNGLIHYYDCNDRLAIYQTSSFGSLPSCVRTNLNQGLIESAAAGFNRPVTPEFAADVDAHIRDGDLMIAFQDGVARGFAVCKVIKEARAVYVSGIVKHPEAQRGVIEVVLANYLHDAGMPLVITRTQNDKVVKMMDNLCRNLAPVDRMVSPQDLSILEKAGLLSDNVDPETLVVKGHYGSPMIIGERRRVNDQRVRAVTDRLDYQAGDAVLLVGEKRLLRMDL